MSSNWAITPWKQPKNICNNFDYQAMSDWPKAVDSEGSNTRRVSAELSPAWFVSFTTSAKVSGAAELYLSY